MFPLPKKPRCYIRTSTQPLSNRALGASCRNALVCEACRSQHRKVSVTFFSRCVTKTLSILSVIVDLRHNGDAVIVGRKEPNASGGTADPWCVHQRRLSKFISMNLFARRSRRVRYNLFATCQWDECRCSDHSTQNNPVSNSIRMPANGHQSNDVPALTCSSPSVAPTIVTYKHDDVAVCVRPSDLESCFSPTETVRPT